MHLLFLGTCAADYSKKLHGELSNQFDRDARRSTAVLLDGHLLIDCGDWILEELRIAKVKSYQIDRVLISHSHADHFRPEYLCEIARQAGHPIDVYANEDILRILEERGRITSGGQWLVPHALRAEPVPSVVQFDGWTLTPLRSNHQTGIPGEQTMHFLLEKDGRSLFYGTDGAWLPCTTAKYLFGRELNGYLFDATCGDYEDDYRIFEHNTIPMIRMIVTVMRQQKVFAPDAKLILTHLAPSLHKSHAETVEIAAKDNLLVSYDGMELDI